jgi:hypothetical protein
MSEIRHFDTCFIEMLCVRVRECFPRREMMLWLLGVVCDYLRDLREKLGFIHVTISMNIKNNNNGRSRVSRGNILQVRAEPSLLELCRTQLDIHGINKIQKQKKNGLYCSRIFGKTGKKPHLKMPRKASRKSACVIP